MTGSLRQQLSGAQTHWRSVVRMGYPEEKLEEMLTCPVCQDIFKDPRQLPCGHSMCMGCLQTMMAHSDRSFRCPDCRGDFGTIINVQKNYALSSIVEDFTVNRRRKDEQKKTVFCDFCSEKATLATKTCLKCEVSLCKVHLKDHLELQVYTGHPLVSPLGDLQERKCPQHEDEVLRFYCSASRRYICTVCSLQSKQHSLVTEATAALRRQLTEHMDEGWEMLRKQISESKESVRKLQEDLQHQKQKVKPVPSAINNVTVVLLVLWFIVLHYAYNFSVENQTLKETLDKQQARMHRIYTTITEHLADPMRPLVVEDEGLLRLDLDTASPFIRLSADFCTAERVKTKMAYPGSKSRFDEAPQVLSAQCFSSGTHVWEVEAEGYWDISVSYKNIQRKTKYYSAFGKNSLSWSLVHSDKGKLFAYHNGEKVILSSTLQSSRIAVRVDIESGNITFGAVGTAAVTRLYEYKAELTQPVCLGLGLYRVDPPSRASIVKTSSIPAGQSQHPGSTEHRVL